MVYIFNSACSLLLGCFWSPGSPTTRSVPVLFGYYLLLYYQRLHLYHSYAKRSKSRLDQNITARFEIVQFAATRCKRQI